MPRPGEDEDDEQEGGGTATATFDPDEFMKTRQSASAPSSSFDPDSFMQSRKAPSGPPKPAPGTYQMRKGGPTLNADKMGIQGQSREDVMDSLRSSGGPKLSDTAREGMLGFSSGLTGMPESKRPLRDAAKAAATEVEQHPFDRAISSVWPLPPGVRQAYDLAKGMGGATKEAGTGLLRSVGAIDKPDTEGGLSGPEQLAHGVGSIAGQALPFLAGKAGAQAEKVGTASPSLGRVVRTETGALRPIAGHAAEGLGALAGGLAGHFIVGEPIAAAAAGRKFGRAIAEQFLPRNPVEAATTQRAAEEAAGADINRATQIQDVHNRRIEREKAAAEREATRKGAKTLSIPNAATSASPADASALPEPAASASSSTNPKVADMSALTAKRGKGAAGPEEAETATGYEEEGGIPIIGRKLGAKAPEAKTTGSEGTAARWTNESLPQLAKKGNRTAIEQLGRRNLPLPENVRYVMGDVDFPRIVLNPKEVSRFAPESTPIRDMSRPETSSRERIQPAGAGGETIPPVEPLFQTPSMQVPSGPADTVHTGIHMDPVNPEPAAPPVAPSGQEPAATPAGGEPATAEELSPEHVDLPKLKEAFTSAEADRQYVADEFHQGRATYKELQDAQKAAEKAKDAVDEAEGTNEQMRQLHERLAKETERNSPERVDAARGLVLDTIDQLRSLERGGPSWSEYNADTRPTAAGREKGDFYGGKAGKIPLGIATIPWLKNHPKWGWSKLEVAMRSGKSKLYNEVMRAADDHLQGQTTEGRAANDARAQRIVASTPPPPPAKFASFQKPTRLEPPAAEPPATTPPAEAAPPTGSSKTARFSKSQWNRFTEDRKNAEYALAKRRGQTIDIYTKK